MVGDVLRVFHRLRRRGVAPEPGLREASRLRAYFSRCTGPSSKIVRCWWRKFGTRWARQHTVMLTDGAISEPAAHGHE